MSRAGSPRPLGAQDLSALIDGTAGAADGQYLAYHETAWSYRRPNAYTVRNAIGEPVGRIEPADHRTRSTAVLYVAGRPVLVLDVDRSGNTAVRDAAGRPVGEFRRRFGLTTFRLGLLASGRPAGAVEMAAGRPGEATLLGPDGTAVARIVRDAGHRFAGASTSWLWLTPMARAVPGGLLLSAVPALDAMRKAWRRSRR